MRRELRVMKLRPGDIENDSEHDLQCRTPGCGLQARTAAENGAALPYCAPCLSLLPRQWFDALVRHAPLSIYAPQDERADVDAFVEMCDRHIAKKPKKRARRRK